MPNPFLDDPIALLLFAEIRETDDYFKRLRQESWAVKTQLGAEAYRRIHESWGLCRAQLVRDLLDRERFCRTVLPGREMAKRILTSKE